MTIYVYVQMKGKSMYRRITAVFLVSCIFFLVFLVQKSSGADWHYERCVSNKCDKGPAIKFPFYIHGSEQEPFCGLFVLDCGHTGYPVIRLSDNDYVIREISYERRSFWVHNAAVDNIASRCILDIRNVTPPVPNMNVLSISSLHLLSRCKDSEQLEKYRVGCDNETSDGWELAMLGDDENLSSAKQDCEIDVVAPVELRGDEGRNNGTVDFEGLLRRGFALNWTSRDCIRCERSGGHCGRETDTNGFRCYCPYGFEYTVCKSSGKNNSKLILVTAASVGGVVLLLLILGFCFRRRFPLWSCMGFWRSITLENQELETFLKNYGSLAPKRYHYSNVKKMTNSFDTKLGQGGYGSVYKGKLENGTLVAVKVLKESKGNGEEFINEVASISRTSHVNIVTLLGFCVHGHKKALIYEFMSNGSLEKFIYEGKSLVNRQLEWPSLYKIALGIARGLEYLHRDCNTRILHFDIKPQNILLDEDFCPKISDFGLAKLCTRKDSIISTMAARGTIGYIAPEIVCTNIGRVSHKSDVYSYGMMVLEMVGGRKNVDVGVDHESEIYFPDWIYSRLSQGDELGLLGTKDEVENKQARKMLMVSLWCIQTNPSSRPRISDVLEMLEGPLEALKMPPRPFLYSPSRASSEEGSTKPCNSAASLAY